MRMEIDMNIEQERAAFEAWYQHHHGDRDVYALDESGEYADKQVQGAFNVWQARAALQSQVKEDAERYRWLRDNAQLFSHFAEEGNSGWCVMRRDSAIRRVFAYNHAELHAAIDQDRRIES